MQLRPIIAILAMSPSLVSQTTWYIDASALPGGNGSVGAPFTSIQTGVNAAVAGDTVLVAPGTYVGSVTIAKDITVRSTQGPEVTLLGYVNPGCAMTIISITTMSACVIEGLTLTGCHGADTGCTTAPTAGGLMIDGGSPIVRRCIIKDNIGGSGNICLPNGPYSGAAQAGGVAIAHTSFPVLENCVITGNTGGAGYSTYVGTQFYGSRGGAGGVGVWSFVTLRHCTITGNTGGQGSTLPSGRGGVDVGGFPQTTLIDCIVWGNTAGAGWTFSGPSDEEMGGPWPVFPYLKPTATWCDVRGGYPGTGNFDADPMFVNPGTDFRLSTGSPCVDRGTLAGVFGDLDYVWRPQYLEVDVGAYEWRPPAALTLAIAQPGGPSWAAISTSGGGAGDFYINLITADPENGGPYAGQGPWGGLWIPPEEMLFQVGLGAPPFVGALDANGSAATGIWLPPGLTGVVIYAISHTVGSTLVNRRSPVVAYTFL